MANKLPYFKGIDQDKLRLFTTPHPTYHLVYVYPDLETLRDKTTPRVLPPSLNPPSPSRSMSLLSPPLTLKSLRPFFPFPIPKVDEIVNLKYLVCGVWAGSPPLREIFPFF